jgi:alkylation response protein AidB-like acyl-CoA dehydrogenase
LRHLLTAEQEARYAAFKRFVATHVEPHAAAWEREQRLPGDILSMMGREGYLGANLPTGYGGQGWDIVTFGLLNEAFGRGSSSLTGVLTVQSMVAMAVLKWGTSGQKDEWLRRLATGEVIAAIALTEPGGGSALQAMTTAYSRRPGSDVLLLNGTKRWISCGQQAGVYLVYGKLEGAPVACLVPRQSAGLEVEPIRELMGFRAAGLAKLTFKDVEVPVSNIVGKPGFALSHVATVSLQYGRISTACSALGLIRGCFEESIVHAADRKIGEQTVGEFGMIRSLIAGMGTDLAAAGALCHAACRSEDERAPEAFEKALMAKYFTSRVAVRVASEAVQIRGAWGCHESSPTARYYQGAKIMEIIEGTTQIHEELLGHIFVQQAGGLNRAAGLPATP